MTYIILAIALLTALVAYNRFTIWRTGRIIDQRIEALTHNPTGMDTNTLNAVVDEVEAEQ